MFAILLILLIQRLPTSHDNRCIHELAEEKRLYNSSNMYDAETERKIANTERFLNETIVVQLEDIRAKIVTLERRLINVEDRAHILEVQSSYA